MYRVAVLTDPQNADGFRLAGVEVTVASSPAEARDRLAELVDDDTTGILAVNETMLSAIDDRLQKKIDASWRPIVIGLPIQDHLQTGEGHKTYLARLIRRAVGFDITLRRQ